MEVNHKKKSVHVQLISEEVEELLKQLPQFLESKAAGRKQILKECVTLLVENRKEAGQPFDSLEQKALPYVCLLVTLCVSTLSS